MERPRLVICSVGDGQFLCFWRPHTRVRRAHNAQYTSVQANASTSLPFVLTMPFGTFATALLLFLIRVPQSLLSIWTSTTQIYDKPPSLSSPILRRTLFIALQIDPLARFCACSAFVFLMSLFPRCFPSRFFLRLTSRVIFLHISTGPGELPTTLGYDHVQDDEQEYFVRAIAARLFWPVIVATHVLVARPTSSTFGVPVVVHWSSCLFDFVRLYFCVSE